MTLEIVQAHGPESPKLTRDEVRQRVAELKALAATVKSEAEAREIISRISSLVRKYRLQNGIGTAPSPIDMAQKVNRDYQVRPHLQLLSDEVLAAVQDVERGHDVKLAVSMPPRAGKSTMTSLYNPLWMLQRHPEWKIVMTSYDPGLTTAWAREIRHQIEDRPEIGVALKRDGGAGGRWQTQEGGGMYSVGIGGALTGRGARVMIIDDPVADFVAAHSPRIRQNIWNWWLSVAQTRLEPPSLVIVVMTRWHEDDFVGRLLSSEHEGDPKEWRQIVLPAIADTANDALGREEGQPLYSPLLVEDEVAAIQRWDKVKEAVGTYTFSAMYQQRPAPQAGAIFDTSWWRYWTNDPARATDDGRVVYLEPGGLIHARWIDSWDFAFKGSVGSDWVVGQRWAKEGANRYLIAQKRDRMTFTQTIKAMEDWSHHDNPSLSPYGHFVHERIIEDKANGPAVIDVLRDSISGIKAVSPNISKEGRARIVTPEIESGNVFLPHPNDPGNEWVQDLMSELRNFPYDAHDDQVDTLTQALGELRDTGWGQVIVPGAAKNGQGPRLVPSTLARRPASIPSGLRRR